MTNAQSVATVVTARQAGVVPPQAHLAAVPEADDVEQVASVVYVAQVAFFS